MKIVFAPDKFKGTLSASDVCGILHRAFHNVMPEAEYISCPMSDGGEDFTRTIAQSCGGTMIQTNVYNAQMREISASCLILPGGETAVLDVSSACGLAQIPEGKTDQLSATSYGVGQLIALAVSHGVRKIIVGLGGSACTDGGTGMAQALGVVFRDDRGNVLTPGRTNVANIDTIDYSSVNPALSDIQFTAAVDVMNPLTGPNGTAAIYAPQKGADAATVDILEEGLSHLKDIWAKSSMWSIAEEPGFGAAGGLGAAMKIYLHASIESGADILFHLNHFHEMISDADYVITGEGKTDCQTEFGKVCLKVADIVRDSNAQIILLSGAITADDMFLMRHFDAAFSTLRTLAPEQQIFEHAKDNLFFAATQIAKVIHGRKCLS